MTDLHRFTRRQRRCAFLRNLRSAALAVAVVMLPELTTFVRHQTYTREAVSELAHALAVAALLVLFNYVQRAAAADTSRANRLRALLAPRRRNGRH